MSLLKKIFDCIAGGKQKAEHNLPDDPVRRASEIKNPVKRAQAFIDLASVDENLSIRLLSGLSAIPMDLPEDVNLAELFINGRPATIYNYRLYREDRVMAGARKMITEAITALEKGMATQKDLDNLATLDQGRFIYVSAQQIWDKLNIDYKDGKLDENGFKVLMRELYSAITPPSLENPQQVAQHYVLSTLGNALTEAQRKLTASLKRTGEDEAIKKDAMKVNVASIFFSRLSSDGKLKEHMQILGLGISSPQRAMEVSCFEMLLRMNDKPGGITLNDLRQYTEFAKPQQYVPSPDNI